MKIIMIKRKSAFWAIIMVGLLCLMTGCSMNRQVQLPVLNLEALPPSGSNTIIGELSLDKKLNTDIERDSAMVFETSTVEVSVDEVLSLKNKLGLGDCTFFDNDKTMGVSDGKGNSIIVFKASGSIVYSSEEENNLILSETEAVYSNEQYIKIANEWLESLGMLTDGYNEKDPTIADNGLVTKTGADGKDYFYPTLKTVTYMYRDLFGVEVSGVAPRIIVDISLDGKVVSATKIQREYIPLDEYPLCSIEDAVSKLENGEGVFYFSDVAGSFGVIESVELSYYNTEVMDECPYLVPVYIFKGSSGGTEISAIVFALEDECYTVK